MLAKLDSVQDKIDLRDNRNLDEKMADGRAEKDTGRVTQDEAGDYIDVRKQQAAGKAAFDAGKTKYSPPADTPPPRGKGTESPKPKIAGDWKTDPTLLGDLKITYEVNVEDDGPAMVTEKAADALTDLNKRGDALNRLLKCVA
jgi:hypothetical protein